MASKATTDLLLIAAIVGGGYLILKTTGLGKGVTEAVGGVGAGLGEAGRGLGGGIARSAEAAGLSIQDILGITALLRPIGAVGEAGVSEIERWAAAREREYGQEEEIDVMAFEQEKRIIAEIQAEQERKTAQEAAERKRLIEEEKTQYVEFATTLPERLKRYLGAGALAAWRYSPLGLLQSYIMGQVSIEEEAAPQQSATITTGGGGAAPISTISGGAIAPTISGGRGVSRTLREYEVTRGAAIQELDSGIITLFPESTIEEVTAPEPEPERAWYDPRGWFGW